jgi:DNA primase
MDVIALHAAGFENAVATLGTAITAEQARMIARYTKKVVLIYDSDDAGKKADDRAMKLLDEVDIDVRVLKLKGAKDPDEYIKTFGKARFAQELSDSYSGFEYKLLNIISKYDLQNSEGKIRATKEICSIIANSGSNVEREVYIASAAEKLGLTAESIKNDVDRIRRKMFSEYKKNQTQNAVNHAKKYGDTINIDAAKNVMASGAEDVILGMMLLYADHRQSVVNKTVDICAEDFFTEFGKRVFSRICELEMSEDGYSRAGLCQYFTADEQGRLQRLEHSRAMLSDNGLLILKQAIDVLRAENARRQAEASGDKLAVLRLKRQNNDKNKK